MSYTIVYILFRQRLHGVVDQRVDVGLHAPGDGLQPLRLKALFDFAERHLNWIELGRISNIEQGTVA